MNQKLILKLSIIGFFFVVLLGSFFHFIFELSGRNFIVAWFSPVNESVWEHMKLSTFPLLLFAGVEAWFLKKNLKNFLLAKTTEIYSAIVFMIAFFYSYTSILGKNLLFLDIGSFVLAVILSKTLSYQILTKLKKQLGNPIIWASFIIILIFFFFIAVFNPPRIALFRESLNNTYGFYQLK